MQLKSQDIVRLYKAESSGLVYLAAAGSGDHQALSTPNSTRRANKTGRTTSIARSLGTIQG